ncbi:MAG TPA: inositol monophosphatase [Candidatus Ornithospirochaeta avicola]|uniref:Inositol-1-monophosphatase n=1 Tax=Candidatus Ornithospirochaeta avicola TaxID=2840896 RepID=A0A9D1PVJ6_9SPIO|nr:inositol monophosphatase [Candidatus Ornithospirochaeta avicola]
MKEKIECALKAADMASSFLLSHTEERKEVESKKENDYVTLADKEAERIIISVISTAFPSDSIYAEESGGKITDGPLWVIDPIDGTVNFMNTFPSYTISICYMEKGEALFGIVRNVCRGETFFAQRGKGAFLNGKKISVSSLDSKHGLCIAVPPHRKHSKLDSYLKEFRRIYNYFSDIRSIGSAALSLSYVASGRVCSYYERYLQLYDVAAGLLIAEEAGAVNEVTEDEDGLVVISSSPSSYPDIKRAIEGV